MEERATKLNITFDGWMFIISSPNEYWKRKRDVWMNKKDRERSTVPILSYEWMNEWARKEKNDVKKTKQNKKIKPNLPVVMLVAVVVFDHHNRKIVQQAFFSVVLFVDFFFYLSIMVWFDLVVWYARNVILTLLIRIFCLCCCWKDLDRFYLREAIFLSKHPHSGMYVFFLIEKCCREGNLKKR